MHNNAAAKLAKAYLRVAFDNRSNAAMQKNAEKVQTRMATNPRTPAQAAANVVERVIATGGKDLSGDQTSLSFGGGSLLCWM